MKEYLENINEDIKDIFEHEIETTNAYSVPGRDDVGLTFSRNQIKKGKLIKTCVLFVDIRHSTRISRILKSDKVKLGKIYSAFIYAMTTIADKYGFVRNIIGDRVMVVFEPMSCFIDAINCAALMNTVSNKIIRKYVPNNLFKVGIGIEYGEMLILKTGIAKQQEEKSEYKNLVWVGDAANLASKLTDKANTQIEIPIHKIKYEVNTTDLYNSNYPWLNNLLTGNSGYKNLSQLLDGSNRNKKILNVELTDEEYKNKVNLNYDYSKYKDNKIISDRIENKYETSPPVLITGNVYKEYRKNNLHGLFTRSFEYKKYSLPFLHDTRIYGGDPIYSEIKTLNL